MPKGQNSQWLKRANRLTLLKILAEGEATRGDLARRSGLAASTVSVLINELIQDGRLIELPENASTGGRPSVPIRLNPDFGTLLLFEVGGRRIVAKRYNLHLDILEETLLSEKALTQRKLFEAILNYLSALQKEDEPDALGLLYDETILPSEKQIIFSEWDAETALSLTEALKIKLKKPVLEQTVDTHAFWQALPEPSENAAYIELAERLSVQVYLKGRRVPLRPELVSDKRTTPSVLVALMTLLWSVFPLQNIYLNGKKTTDDGFMSHMRRLLRKNTPTSLREHVKPLTEQAREEAGMEYKETVGRFLRRLCVQSLGE